MSNSTTTHINGIQTFNTVLDCTKTHWLNTYFSQTALISQSAYDEADLDSHCKNHDISYVPHTVIIALLPHVWQVPGSDLSMRTDMLTSIFHILPQPQKVNSSTLFFFVPCIFDSIKILSTNNFHWLIPQYCDFSKAQQVLPEDGPIGPKHVGAKEIF